VAWRRMIVTEGKLVRRDPAGVFLPLALPLLMIAMYGLSSGDGPAEGSAGIPAVSAIGIPTGLVTIVAILGLVNVPSFLAAYRRDGVLRRLAVTPASPTMVLAAQVVVNVALAALGVLLAVLVVALTFGLTPPRLLGWALLSTLLAVAAFYGLGLVISAVAPSSSAATAIGLVALLLTLSIGGGMLPVENLPDPLATAGRLLPFGAAVQALRDSWVGTVPAAGDLTVLAVTAVVAAVLSVRLFRWQ